LRPIPAKNKNGKGRVFVTRRTLWFLGGLSLVVLGAGIYIFVVKPMAVREAGPLLQKQGPGRTRENAFLEERRTTEEESRRLKPVSGTPHDPTADVRRTLETIQEINRLNRMNQEQQQRQKKQ
jgi:hypothetical protein